MIAMILSITALVVAVLTIFVRRQKDEAMITQLRASIDTCSHALEKLSARVDYFHQGEETHHARIREVFDDHKELLKTIKSMENILEATRLRVGICEESLNRKVSKRKLGKKVRAVITTGPSTKRRHHKESV